jgi:type 1 glutamine amidotransferase
MNAALALAALLGLAAQEPPKARKAVLIAGPLDSHPKDTHEYEKNVILLKHLLDTTPSLKGLRTEVHFNGWPERPETLEDADTILLTSGGCDRRLEDHPFYVGDRLAVLERQMKRGCGLVLFHWSTFHPVRHEDKILEWVGGFFDYERGPASAGAGKTWYSKIQTREWTTALGAPDHPVARGVTPFTLREEFYFNLRFRPNDPRLKPILLKEAGGDTLHDTVGWAVERADGGRGFGFTGGHFYANWWIPEFRKLVLNAVAWTAKAEVPPAGVESALEDPIRATVLTGHHFPAHDWKSTTPALIRALEQDPRVRVSVTEDIEDLATAKIEKEDVLVLNYMNWGRPGLSEAGKRGLIRHLERGGGFVVFHGATGTWNATLTPKESDWPEFRTKILARWWDHPKSGHDDFGPFRVEIAAPGHPITEGLAAFDTKDELYVRLAGDAPAEALVTAYSKVAGRQEPLAWAHAYGKGRVFETSLGHAAESVRHAGALFRRGAVWAAGKPRLSFDPPAGRAEQAAPRRGDWAPRKAAEAPKEEGKAPRPPAAAPQDSGKVLPADPGLDGGKGGHWGLQGEKDWADGRWNQTDVGPFVTSSLAIPGGAVLKAISIKVPGGGVVFDAERPGLRAGWTGPFLAFSPARYGLIEMPRIAGEVRWTAPGAEGRYRGLSLNGDRVVLSYEVGGVPVLESPWAESADGRTVFTRTLRIGPGKTPADLGVVPSETVLTKGGPERVKVFLWGGPRDELSKFRAHVDAAPGPEDLDALARGAAPRWKEALATKGHVSKEKGPYVVDTLTIPYANPWKALFFLGGLDFFPNGDAAVCTIHGDVWTVGGIDAGLEKLTWRRFATGLYQPLGLRIVDGKAHVLGRDRITRLHDRNGDGEADFYESFADALPASARGHDYITCLETDAAGNFYFVSGQGVYRVPPDGAKAECLATGLRNPNGLSVGPDGTITAAPQEGEWTPASMICEVRPGGHYGYGGPKGGVDPPLCYLPRLIDNSTGGQVWVTSDRWGPLRGQLLNLSFGRCSMQLVLREKGQGAVVPLRLAFASGVHRGRFRPADGQLYVAGTKGWVSSAVRDGCLQRVRYAGGKLLLPVGIETRAGGVRLGFSEPLDRALAEDTDSYALEQWNYRYSEKYGSEDYSAVRPQSVGHDGVEVKSAKLLPDGRSVLLEIPALRPVHQLRIRYSIRDVEGAPLRGEVVATVHRLP